MPTRPRARSAPRSSWRTPTACPRTRRTIDDPDFEGLVYTREHGANQRGLEEKLARLDHGEAAAVFGTGMAALHAAFFTILNPGDHAIVSNVVYMRVAGLFDKLFPAKLGHRGRLRRHHRPRGRPRRRTTHHPARPHRGHRQPRPPRRRRRGPGADRPRRGRPAHHRLHLHPAARDAPTRPRRGPGHPLAHQVLQRSRRRDGRRRHRGPHPRRGGAHRRDVARRRRHLTVQRLAHHARLHHPAAAAAAAVRERPGRRRVPRRRPARRPRRLPGTGRPRPARRSGRPAQPADSAESSRSPSPARTRTALRFVNDLRVITSAVSLGHDETLVAYEQYPDGPAAAFAQPFREHGLVRLAIGLEAAEDLIADLDAVPHHRLRSAAS